MLQGELELFKPGKGAFYATELQEWLQARHITHLLFAGVTTEVRDICIRCAVNSILCNLHDMCALARLQLRIPHIPPDA